MNTEADAKKMKNEQTYKEMKEMQEKINELLGNLSRDQFEEKLNEYDIVFKCESFFNLLNLNLL